MVPVHQGDPPHAASQRGQTGAQYFLTISNVGFGPTTGTVTVVDTLPVIGNPHYLERAIGNLIDNAIKYTREHGTVSVTAKPEGDQVVVEVTDDGIGIAADDLPRIFERFYRVDRSRSREMGGTGLGLSIVKHVVQVHGGTVDVTSTPGAGSCFTVRLPAAAADALQPEEGVARATA